MAVMDDERRDSVGKRAINRQSHVYGSRVAPQNREPGIKSNGEICRDLGIIYLDYGVLRQFYFIELSQL